MIDKYFNSFCNSINCVYLSKRYRINTNKPEATRALTIPFKTARKIYGRIINQRVAPTNCILLIKNLSENMARRIVLSINMTAIIKRKRVRTKLYKKDI